jgi:hypothetical protein
MAKRRNGKKRKRTRSDPPVRVYPWEEAVSVCGWCGKEIPEDTELFTIGAKTRAGIDLTGQVGQAIEISLAPMEKTVLAVVPAEDSAAKRDGVDLFFVVCSAECGGLLKETLQKQVESMNRWLAEVAD